ncbi:MAG: hypothetical protein L3J83_05525 [Proteobacteria bacterium]|nr:hypothetical protein [Pseudomonadota bacterium]
MRSIITLLMVAVLCAEVSADQDTKKSEESNAPPGTEIVLANIKVSKGQVRLSNAQNITSRIGYDSQPVFMEKGKALYFTRYINKQTDIYRINLKTREAKPYMQTPESEYSATPIAGREGISVVQVSLDKKPDGTDRQSVVWLHKNKRSNQQGLMSGIDNVGYHNWMGKNKLWMFVINGEIGNLYYQTTGKKPRQMASNIGRAIKTDAKYKNLYYVDKSQDDWWITKIDNKKFKQTKIIALPKGVEDFARDSKGNFWCGKGNTLYFSDKGKNWTLVKEFSIPDLSNITRIAVNSKMTQIAITFNEI